MARASENKREDREGSELIERLVGINRVSKTVKGGKRFGFAALVVVGDGRGRVGFGSSKAREVPDAIKKATEQAKRKMIRVPLREARTLHHDIHGRDGAGKVFLRSAVPGTGIIAGGPLRAIFEALGIQDVVAKVQDRTTRTAWSTPPSPLWRKCRARVRLRPAVARKSAISSSTAKPLPRKPMSPPAPKLPVTKNRKYKQGSES